MRLPSQAQGLHSNGWPSSGITCAPRCSHCSTESRSEWLLRIDTRSGDSRRPVCRLTESDIPKRLDFAYSPSDDEQAAGYQMGNDWSPRGCCLVDETCVRARASELGCGLLGCHWRCTVGSVGRPPYETAGAVVDQKNDGDGPPCGGDCKVSGRNKCHVHDRSLWDRLFGHRDSFHSSRNELAGYAVLRTGTGSAISLGTQGISTTRSGIERLKLHFGADAVGILDVLSAIRKLRELAPLFAGSR